MFGHGGVGRWVCGQRGLHLPTATDEVNAHPIGMHSGLRGGENANAMNDLFNEIMCSVKCFYGYS